MTNIFTAKWPFYVAGIALPILILLGLFCFDSVLGLSESWLELSAYFEDKPNDLPPLNWQTALLGGIFIGALIGALASNQFKFELLMPTEGSSFGTKFMRTAIAMVGGGFLVMVGSQLAGEVPFGQLAAAIQMAPGAWLYIASFIVTAVFLSILWAQKSGGGGKGASKSGASATAGEAAPKKTTPRK